MEDQKKQMEEQNIEQYAYLHDEVERVREEEGRRLQEKLDELTRQYEKRASQVRTHQTQARPQQTQARPQQAQTRTLRSDPEVSLHPIRQVSVKILIILSINYNAYKVELPIRTAAGGNGSGERRDEYGRVRLYQLPILEPPGSRTNL